MLANLQLINAAAVPIIRAGRQAGGRRCVTGGMEWAEWSGVAVLCLAVRLLQ